MHIDNKKRDILIPGNGQTKGLDDTAMISKTKYFINFSSKDRNFVIL